MEMARQVLTQREQARSSLLGFTQFHKPNYRPSAHHRIVADALDRVERGEIDRLQLWAPPRHGKSELSSRKFPAYYMSRHPHDEFILASYGTELSHDFGREVRNVMESPRNQALFPKVHLASDSTAKGFWRTTDNGLFLAASIGSPMTGFGANVLGIDDPFKTRAEAESPTFRDSVWNWYRSVAYPRLMPGGAIILTMTRWHEDDLAGRLDAAEENGGDKWTRIVLPALDEWGNALWEERYPVSRLAAIRKSVGEREWASLYEQRPRPIEGSFFMERDMLVDGQPVDPPITCDAVFGTLDSGVKTGKGRDGTAVVYWARDRYGAVPLATLDWDILQIDGALLETWVPQVFTNLEDFAKTCGARMGSLGLFIEDAASGSILLQQCANKGLPVTAIDSSLTAQGKVERGIGVSGHVNSGKVKFTKHAYHKTKTYKGRTRNHLLSQVLSFEPAVKDMGEDDLFDGWCYGIALGVEGG
jgi:hypothetical protein